MRQSIVPVITGCIILLAIAGAAAADPVADNTTTIPAVNSTASLQETTAAPGDTGGSGGSVFFDTSPEGASVWVDEQNLGMSPFTYYFPQPGTLNVTIRKKGFADYSGTVDVSPGKRNVFTADLEMNVVNALAETTTVTPVETVTTLKRSTIPIPTPWPTTEASPGPDPTTVIGTVSLVAGLVLLQRR